MSLEVLERMELAQGRPILFIHGILSGAWIWDVHFLPWFAEQGYRAYALSLRGHGQSPAGKALDQLALSDFVEDVRQVVLQIQNATGQEPILVGHSMGGMVVQRYLSYYRAPAAVLLCSIPPQGMMPLSLTSLFTNPLIALQMAKVYSFPDLADTKIAREVLFHHPVAEADLENWFKDVQRESMRLLWDMNVSLPLVLQVRKTPLCVMGARYDRLVPNDIVNWTAATYGTTPLWVDAGHAIMLEQNWQESAHLLHQNLQKLMENTPC